MSYFPCDIPFEEECYSLDDVLPMNGFLKWLEEEMEEDNVKD